MSETLYPGSRHRITIRTPSFPFDGSIPRHWNGNNAVATHIFNGLQLLFPDGERFFIRTVQSFAGVVRDPALREQARSFAEQEALHTREHQRMNEMLEAQGYDLAPFLARFGGFMRWVQRTLPKPVQIAMTAGAEHYTARLGSLVIRHPQLRADMHPVIEELLVWHACEEVEHKAVAYDVMQEAGVGYLTRILGYFIVTFVLFGFAASGTRILLRQDGLTRAEIAVLHESVPGWRDREILRESTSALFAYLRPGFHPNDQDDLEAACREISRIEAVTSAA